MKSKGFTLVEILVVVSIIGILAAILVPVVARSKTKAKIAMAKVQMNDLAVAIKSYKSDYQRYPLPSFVPQSGPAPKVNAGKDASFGSPVYHKKENQQKYIVSILWDRNNKRNPKKNVYLNVKESGEDYIIWDANDEIDSLVRQPGRSNDGYYLDPFGNAYNISVDKNADGYCVDKVYSSLRSGSDVGMVSVPGFSGVQGVKGSDVLIWTDGPDLKASASQGAIDGDNADNILSWK